MQVRAATPGDREEFLARVRDSRRLHRPWVHAPATPAAYRAWLRRAGPEFIPLLACRRSDGAIVALTGGVLSALLIRRSDFIVTQGREESGRQEGAAAAGVG